MPRWTALLTVLLVVSLAAAQGAPTAAVKEAPQTARQALLEAFFGESPNHLEKHLPEITKKALRQLDSGTGAPNLLTQIAGIGMEAKHAGSNFQIMDTGPVLLAVEDPGRQKFEAVVERDDLAGDENLIELSFHLYKNGKEEGLPVIPRLTFSMKPEANVWRIYDVNLSVRAPLADPDFLATLVSKLQEDQQNSNEAFATMSLRAIASDESAYQSYSESHSYTCSLPKLAEASKPEKGEYPNVLIDEQLASGKKQGYIFALTGCDASHFKAVAEPATPSAGRRAFCIDEAGVLKFSSDGKATTCLSHGEPYDGQGGMGAGVRY